MCFTENREPKTENGIGAAVLHLTPATPVR